MWYLPTSMVRARCRSLQEVELRVIIVLGTIGMWRNYQFHVSGSHVYDLTQVCVHLQPLHLTHLRNIVILSCHHVAKTSGSYRHWPDYEYSQPGGKAPGRLKWILIPQSFQTPAPHGLLRPPSLTTGPPIFIHHKSNRIAKSL
jgi:hypothetical protein